MKLPIQYALGFPEKAGQRFQTFRFPRFSSFTFESPDYKTFRNLALAKDTMFKGGNAPCVLNAANEVVVHAFLQNKVGFLEMNDIIESALNKISFIEAPVMADLEQTDAETRKFTESMVKKASYIVNLQAGKLYRTKQNRKIKNALCQEFGCRLFTIYYGALAIDCHYTKEVTFSSRAYLKHGLRSSTSSLISFSFSNIMPFFLFEEKR